MKMDIVLQGPMHSYTPAIAREYAKLSFVNNVIISCWDTCPTYDIDDNINIIRSPDAPTPGFGNKNRQIKSSRNGLDCVITEFSAKLRTDQHISDNSMYKLYNYYFSNCEYTIDKTDSTPYNKIGVHGISRDFPFCPIDHILWGNTQDLLKFFDMEYENKQDAPAGIAHYDYYIRPEIHFGISYITKHHKELKYFLENESDYLLDNSPKRNDALIISEKIMPELFCVFPKIDLNWIKYNMPSYHYDVMESEIGGRNYWADSV
jgi:hypothetical protein